MKAKGASLPEPAGSLAVTVTLGASVDAGLSGACGSVPLGSCTLKGSTLRCR